MLSIGELLQNHSNVRGSETRDARGQSAIIGVVLLLALTFLAATAVVALGNSALTDTQRQSELGQAEHSMTQFDSMAAQVALGDSNVQSLGVGQVGGDYRVDPSAGNVQIVHVNYSGNDKTETVYQADLGAVVYETGNHTIVYQGGGVWRKGPTGQSRMVSPPEFHYRGATLTFPVVRVNPGGPTASATGSPTITIKQDGSSTDVYPDPGTTYSGTSKKYLNPADNGTAFVDIQSEYYEAWADYFRSRTDGTVTTFASNQTARIHLISTGKTGDFDMPQEGGSIEVRGVEDHSMSDFSIRIRPPDNDSANFADLQWSWYVVDGNKQFELHLRQNTGASCGETVETSVYYSENNGNDYHGWHTTNGYTAECADLNGDGDDEVYIDVDFVDDEDGDNDVAEIESGDPVLTYQDLGSSNVIHFNNPNNNNLIDPVTFDEHQDDVSWESKSYSDGDTESIDRLVNHYFSELGPSFDLTVADKNGNGGSVNEATSSGTIQYSGADKFITYMHLTENRVQVRFD